MTLAVTETPDQPSQSAAAPAILGYQEQTYSNWLEYSMIFAGLVLVSISFWWGSSLTTGTARALLAGPAMLFSSLVGLKAIVIWCYWRHGR